MKKRLGMLVLILLFLVTLLLPMAGCTKVAEAIKFAKSYYSLKEGETIQAEVIVTPALPFTLTTEFSGIAQVEGGAIKGISRGKTVLTATAGGLSAQVQVEVLQKDGSSNLPGEGKVLVLYVIDEKLNNYYTNYINVGDSTPDLKLGREGYDFSGWFSDNTYQTRFDFNTPILEQTKIFGKYAVVQGDQTPLLYSSPKNGKVEVTGLKYKTVPYTDITIPQTMTHSDGTVYPVRGVAAGAMQGIKTLQKLQMPYVEYLGDNAFAGCVALSGITANQNLTYVGQNLFQDTPWLATEKKRTFQVGKVAYYHGAQLGNCYLYSTNAQAMYLYPTTAEFPPQQYPKVTLFAKGALYEKAAIFVPKDDFYYYYNHQNLASLKGKVRGFVVENNALSPWNP